MHACLTTIITDKCCMLSMGRENNGELASAPAFLLPLRPGIEAGHATAWTGHP